MFFKKGKKKRKGCGFPISHDFLGTVEPMLGAII